MARYPKGTTPTLTHELIEDLCVAIRQGVYVETAVALCGISKDSFYRWVREGENAANEMPFRLVESLKQAMAESELRDLKTIDDAAQGGDWKAAAWRLERKFPARWGAKSKIELEHAVLSPEEKSIKERSTDELEAELRQLESKLRLIEGTRAKDGNE